MPYKNWQFELEEYIKQGEPDRAEKSEAWQTAIGLQAVDGLNTSAYLLDTAKDHIEGKITIEKPRSGFTVIMSSALSAPRRKTKPKRQISYPQESRNCWEKKRFSFPLPSGLPFTADCLRACSTTPVKSGNITSPRKSGC